MIASNHIYLMIILCLHTVTWFRIIIIIIVIIGLGSWRTSGDRPNYGIIENGQNTEKSPGDLRKLEETYCLWIEIERMRKEGYFDLARELKKLWNMKVTIIPIVIRTLGTVTKGLVHGREDLEITGRVWTIQTTALLRSARILRRVLETWDLLSLKLQWKTIS